MDKSIARRWAQALRSEEFTQLIGRLEGQPQHCCALGVLWRMFENEYHGHHPQQLPKDVMEWAGLSREGAWYVIRENDINRSTFNQIADFVEGYAEGL